MIGASFRSAIFAAVSSTVLGAAISASSAAPGCTDFESRIVAANKAGDADLAADLYLAVEASAACSGQPLFLMGRNTAYAFYHQAYADGVSGTQRDQMLRRALGFGRPWQVLAAVADAEKTGRRYSEAAALYQEALDDIRDEALNPTPPPVAVIASIFKKAEETRLLADHYVKRVDRSGHPGGLAQRRFRGFEARRTAVPVHFEFDSDEFTLEGRQAVADMLGYLTAEGAPDIELIGHTDPRGTLVYNQALSVRRAAAVKTFLVAQAYGGQVHVDGRGEAEPFEPDDPGGYTQDETWQLDRRVELLR